MVANAAAPPRAERQGRKAPARLASTHVWFFPAAAALALVAVPLGTAAHVGVLALPFAAEAAWHAHEMLFGYALAVVAGFLLARLGRGWLLLLFAAWLLGRAATFMSDGSVAGGIAALLFPALLAWRVAPMFLRSVKKTTNRIFAPVLAGFLLAEAVYQAGRIEVLGYGRALGLRLAVDLVTLLLALMGGRIIAAATAGALYRRGDMLGAGVQPRLERALLAALAGLLFLDLIPGAGLLAGLASGLAGALAWWRLAGWRTWSIRNDPELLGLHAGYAWLAIGLVAKGAALAFGTPPIADIQHAPTIGALGTLTMVMMLRATAQRRAPPAVVPRAIGLLSGTVTLATLARLAAVLPTATPTSRASVAPRLCGASASSSSVHSTSKSLRRPTGERASEPPPPCQVLPGAALIRHARGAVLGGSKRGQHGRGHALACGRRRRAPATASGRPHRGGVRAGRPAADLYRP